MSKIQINRLTNANCRLKNCQGKRYNILKLNSRCENKEQAIIHAQVALSQKNISKIEGSLSLYRFMLIYFILRLFIEIGIMG